MRSPILMMVLLGGLAHAAPPKSLAELNELTKLLASKVTMGPGEVDVAEVVAVRDSTRPPSPMAIAYAAAIEQSLASEELKPERGNKVLFDLAMALASFGGPQAEWFHESFLPVLNAALNIKPGDAKPRPQLAKELAEVGEWAAATVNRLAAKMPAATGDAAKARVAMERGHYAEAAALARKHLQGAKPGAKIDPHWQARLGAALLLGGKEKEAQPYLAAAEATGGEADRISRLARVLHAHLVAVDHAIRALKTVGLTVIPIESGGRQRAVPDACRTFFESKTTRAPAAAAAASVACTTVLWDAPGRTWLSRAAELAPAGAEGAAVRAAAALNTLVARDPHAKQPADLDAALATYLAELKLLQLAPEERTILTLLGHLGVAPKPTEWSPKTAEELALVAELAEKSPCQSDGFALRAVAVRSDRAALAKFVEDAVSKCADAPGGAAVTANAIGLLLQLAYEEPSQLTQPELEPLVLKFARGHDDDADAIGVHADAVALKALSGKTPNTAGIEAALARYEQAIARWSPEGGAPLRQRLETNAAYLSLALARLVSAKDSERRDRFYLRAAGHLRLALAIYESPAVTASRAAYDLDTQTGTTVTTIDLPHMTPSRSRNRAACMLAAEASARGDAQVTRSLLLLARARPVGEDHHISVPELLVDTNAQFSALVEERVLHPFIELRTSISLAPPCDPENIPVPKDKPVSRPSDAGASSTPAPHTKAGKSPTP